MCMKELDIITKMQNIVAWICCCCCFEMKLCKWIDNLLNRVFIYVPLLILLLKFWIFMENMWGVKVGKMDEGGVMVSVCLVIHCGREEEGRRRFIWSWVRRVCGCWVLFSSWWWVQGWLEGGMMVFMVADGSSRCKGVLDGDGEVEGGGNMSVVSKKIIQQQNTVGKF